MRELLASLQEYGCLVTPEVRDVLTIPRRITTFPYAWTATWTLLCIVAVWFLVVRENDAPTRYKVPLPKVPEQHEILEEPSIRVRYIHSLQPNPRDSY